MAHCLFCEGLVDDPTNFDQVLPCACGALYWIEFADNLADASFDAMRELGAQSLKDIEIKVERDYDVSLDDESQPIEEGAEVCLVCARLCA